MWRLLGIARLLQQMQDPILKASSQIAALLGQSFFMPFALTVLAILARLRILLLQALHDVILIYNLLSHGCNSKMPTLEPESNSSARLNSKKRVISVQGFSVQDKLPFWLVCCSKETRLFLHELGSVELPEFSGWEAFPSLQWFNDIATQGDLFSELWMEKKTQNNTPQKVQNLKIEEKLGLASFTGIISERPPSASNVKEENLATDSVRAVRAENLNYKEINRKKKELLHFLEQTSSREIPASLQVAGKSSPLGTSDQGSKRKVAYISVGSHSAKRLKFKEGEGNTVGNLGAVHNFEPASMAETESDKVVNCAGSEVKQRTDNLFEMLIGERNFDSLF
ncbi:hypothetical protein O6H91_Y468800 [Diphasiastrum complanatum]|nr:hypothetical protein O6H91_Y468800 [Diphasiastrum complanatum]